MRQICVLLIVFCLLFWQCEKDEEINHKLSYLIGLNSFYDIIKYSVDENEYDTLSKLETDLIPDESTSISGETYTVMHLTEDSKLRLTSLNSNSGIVESEIEIDNLIYGIELSKETNTAYGLTSLGMNNYNLSKININTGELSVLSSSIEGLQDNSPSTLIEKSNLYIVIAISSAAEVIAINYKSGQVAQEIIIPSEELKISKIYSIEYNTRDGYLYILAKHYEYGFCLIKFNLFEKKFEKVIENIDIELDVINTAIDSQNNYYILQYDTFETGKLIVIDLLEYQVTKEINKFKIQFALQAFNI
mgnify:CR=1 FL=1